MDRRTFLGTLAGSAAAAPFAARPAVNRNTAKALGITTPQSILLRADELVQ